MSKKGLGYRAIDRLGAVVKMLPPEHAVMGKSRLLTASKYRYAEESQQPGTKTTCHNWLMTQSWCCKPVTVTCWWVNFSSSHVLAGESLALEKKNPK
jgi:hypothetical protein